MADLREEHPSLGVERTMERWRNELLDLTPSNRLLNFAPGRGSLRIQHPSAARLFDGLANDGRHFKFHRPENLVAGENQEENQLDLVLHSDGGDIAGQTVLTDHQARRPPRDDEFLVDGDPKKIEAALYRLRLRSRTALQEQGVNLLFAAFGALDWSDTRARNSRLLSPLFLLPVALTRESALDPHCLTPLDEGVTLNPALIRKLERDYDLVLSAPVDDESDLDLHRLLDAVRQSLLARPDWRVIDDAFIGLFSFAKYAMYTDLEKSRTRFLAHPVIRLLAREEEGIPVVPADLITSDELDDRVQPGETFQVLDADASQQEAIAAIKAGTNLVIQGPPGTGKSQTITNVIAEVLAQQKTVLFVSEKMAALSVVAKRLDDAGLREFCLIAHGKDANKGAVIRSLAATLTAQKSAETTPPATDLERLSRLRSELNGYVRALHESAEPLGRSAFQVHGELANLTNEAAIHFDLPDIGSLDARRLSGMLDAVESLVRVSDVLLSESKHPWLGCTLRSVTPQILAEFDDQLRQLMVFADQVTVSQHTLRVEWGLPAGTTLTDAVWLRDLLGILDDRPKVPQTWLVSIDLAQLTRDAHRHSKEMTAYRTQRARFIERFDESALGLDLEQIQHELVREGRPATQLIVGHGEPGKRALDRRDSIVSAVDAVCKNFARLDELAGELAGRIGLPPGNTINDMHRLARVSSVVLSNPRPSRDWFMPGRLPGLQRLARDARAKQETFLAKRAELSMRFGDAFWELPLGEMRSRFEAEYSGWTRILKSGYRRDLRRLRKAQTSPTRLDYEEAVSVLHAGGIVRDAQEWIADHGVELSSAFGVHYHGTETDWDLVDHALNAIEELLERVSRPPESLIALLADGGVQSIASVSRVFSSALLEADDALNALVNVIDVDLTPFHVVDIRDVPMSSASSWTQDWSAEVRSFWHAADQWRAHQLGSVAALDEMRTDVAEALALQKRDAELQGMFAALREQIGGYFAGFDTDWERVLSALAWTGRLRSHTGSPLPALFVERLLGDQSTGTSARGDLMLGISRTTELLARLGQHFDRTGPDLLHRHDDVPTSIIAQWARTQRGHLPDLEAWVDYWDARREAEQMGLSQFVMALQREALPPECWRAAFLRQAYTLWLSWRYVQSPALARFRQQRHEQVIAEFRGLDRRHYQATARRIQDRLLQLRPTYSPYASTRSEPAILMREAGKKKRFRALRKLFADLPHLLPALKPCMLMSPLSVAQFLGESDITFDVVVFDEASQILPADAIGAIGRGRQVVIVGDQQQLPPTTFFSSAVLDGLVGDDDEEEMPESVLDACIAAGMPSKPLLWHYRSRHEHLIAFSSKWFYNRDFSDRWLYNPLITFPTVDISKRPVEFVYVEDGVYERSGQSINRTEAKRVADLVVDHVQHRLDQSLGVITFSEAQMVAVQLELDARRRAQPELEALLTEDGSEGFFVKNLENVQGDERDVIFFSVGYGPDAAGRMTMNFGPLNRQGGERRLNVALTRARDQVKILASFRPSAIDRSRTEAKGVRLLRSYLEFAEQGPTALLSDITAAGGAPESPFESAVAGALESEGLTMVSQVGVGAFRIDLAIRDEVSDEYLLGIECDGRTYHSSKTARDRDRLRQDVLERLGWRIHRIWSTDWLKDPRREVVKVLAALDEARVAKEERDRPPAYVASDFRDKVTQSAADLSNAYARRSTDEDGDDLHVTTRADETGPKLSERLAVSNAVQGAPYTLAALGSQGSYENLEWDTWGRLPDLIVQCVNAEGPVHVDRVLRTVGLSYGIQRVGSIVRSNIMAAVQLAAGQKRITVEGKFLWPATMTTPPVRGQLPDGSVRPIEHVSPKEISAAISMVLATSFAMSRSDLIVATARLLGYERSGSQVRAAVDAAIGSLLSGGVIRSAGDQLRLSA